jgi:Glycosyltransferase family 87
MSVVLARSKTLGPAAVVVANGVALGYFLLAWVGRSDLFLDLEVYRLGAQTWRDCGDLYGTLPATSMGIALPFTYPPVAAVLFTPLTLVPLPVAGLGLAMLSLAMLGLVVRPAWGLVLPAAAALEPVRATLSYGQINVVLMALVALDCRVRTPRWPRGVLVGLAAAVKLTPAGFVLLFLLRRDRWAAVQAVAAFLGATLAGFLFAGKDSVRYWTASIYDPGRVGTIHYAGNQSLLGVLARLGLAPPVQTAVWLLGVAAVLAVAIFGMRRGDRRGKHGARGRAQRPRGARLLAGFLVPSLGLGAADPVGHVATAVSAFVGARRGGPRDFHLLAAMVVARVDVEPGIRMEPRPAGVRKRLSVFRGHGAHGQWPVVVTRSEMRTSGPRGFRGGDRVRRDRPMFCPIGHPCPHGRERHWQAWA